MVRTLNDAIATVSQDTAQIQQAYQQLRRDNVARDKALADLTAMVKEYGESPAATRPYGPSTPKINADVLDGDGNLRAADIGITWADNETFLHGVRIVGSKFPRPTGHEPVMSTPYPERGNDGQVTPSMTGRPSSPETIEFGPEIITVNRLRFGMPLVIHSDQGREFENGLMKSLCTLLGCVKTRTAPYHPEADGMVERFYS